MNKVSLSVLESASEARCLGLSEFARSFDHTLVPAYPILIGWVNGELRGYAQMERKWIVTPAIHTSLNTPRDTYLLGKATIEALKQITPGFLVQGSMEKGSLFTNSIMKKWGLEPWPHPVFYNP